jgi:hypothetical protein
MRRPIAISMLLIAMLAGCAPATTPTPAAVATPQPAPLPLPASLGQGGQDPVRRAVTFTNTVFNRPATVARQPAVVAEAVSQYEWLLAYLPTDQRFISAPPAAGSALRLGRDELRRTLGIAAETAPAAVITAFDATAAAMRAGNRAGGLAALGEVTGPAGAERALGVLDALPRLRQTANGAAQAQNALTVMEQSSRNR